MKHCRKKGNRWYYNVSWTDETGKSHTIERAGGSTRSECLKAWRKAKTELDEFGSLRLPSKLTVATALADWLEKEVTVNCKPHTRDAYENVIRNHIIPDFGGKLLAKVPTSYLQEWINGQRYKYRRATIKT